MSGAGVRDTVMRGLALAQIRYVAPVRPGASERLVDRVYRQVERDFGVLAPPVAMHAPAPELMAASWLMLRETLLAPGPAGRPVREAVATAVSSANVCPYCVDVHSATLRDLARDGSAAAAVAAGRYEAVADPAVRAAAGWARAAAVRGGAPGLPSALAARLPGLLGVALTFHYLNRMVNVFLEDAPMPPGAPRMGLGLVKRVLGGMIGAAAARTGDAGASLGLLPAAPLPPDVSWAAGDPCVAEAIARAGAVIEQAGSRSVPAAVRELVLAELAGWDGRPKGSSRAWVEPFLTRVQADDRPAARLALLTAMSSYLVARSDIDDFRRRRSGDVAVLELTSWGAFAAARHIAGWTASAGPERPA